MASWIILSISVVLLLFTIGSGVSTYSWVKGSQSVEGKVVELVQKKRSKKKGGSRTVFAPRVQYEISGEVREFVSSQASSSPGFKVGDKVKVAANLQQDKGCIATFAELYGFSFAGTIIGVALGLIALVFFNSEKILRLLHPNL